MSFLSDDDVNKRAKNLIVGLVNAPPAPQFLKLELRTAQADMTHFATYAAAHPGVVGVGGTWSAANTSPTALLSVGDTVVEFTGNITGSAIGTNSYDPTTVPGCWEVKILDVGTGGCVGEYLGNLFLYDKNVYAGGRFNTGVNISFYETKGKIYGNEVAAPVLATGDIIGMIVYNPQQIDYYLNGVFVDTEQWGGSTVIPMGACGTSP